MEICKSKAPGRIRFDFADAQSAFAKRRAIKSIIREIFSDNGCLLASLQYVFCSDEYLLNLNRKFLNHDTYTDIITFTLSDPAKPIEGEIYISVDRVHENARAVGTTVPSELARVIFHGALHLCGYKDKSAMQKKLMRSQEDLYLSRLS